MLGRITDYVIERLMEPLTERAAPSRPVARTKRPLLPMPGRVLPDVARPLRPALFDGDQRGLVRAANAIAIKDVPPKTRSIPTNRPSAHANASGRPAIMMPASI